MLFQAFGYKKGWWLSWNGVKRFTSRQSWIHSGPSRPAPLEGKCQFAAPVMPLSKMHLGGIFRQALVAGLATARVMSFFFKQKHVQCTDF